MNVIGTHRGGSLSLADIKSGALRPGWHRDAVPQLLLAEEADHSKSMAKVQYSLQRSRREPHSVSVHVTRSEGALGPLVPFPSAYISKRLVFFGSGGSFIRYRMAFCAPQWMPTVALCKLAMG